MTNVQLSLVIGIPAGINAVLIGLCMAYVNAKFDAVNQRFDTVNQRFDAVDARLKHIEEERR